jgi:hypothetical protein
MNGKIIMQELRLLFALKLIRLVIWVLPKGREDTNIICKYTSEMMVKLIEYEKRS